MLRLATRMIVFFFVREDLLKKKRNIDLVGKLIKVNLKEFFFENLNRFLFIFRNLIRIFCKYFLKKKKWPDVFNLLYQNRDIGRFFVLGLKSKKNLNFFFLWSKGLIIKKNLDFFLRRCRRKNFQYFNL